MLRFLWRRYRDRRAPPEVPETHVVPTADAEAGLRRLDGRDSLTWIGHASFLLRLGGTTVLTDPYLTDYASPTRLSGPKRFVPPGIPIEGLPPIDVVLLSHNHYDHLDTRALDRLSRRGPCAAVVPLGLGPYFTRRGFTPVHELDWHERVRFGALTITALPAIHFSARTPFDRNRTLWMSATIETSEQRIYFAGDTAYGPVFRELGARYGPFTVALVGIGAYEPQAIMKATHTTPEEAVRQALDLRAKVVVGMHWGTVALTDEPAFEPPARFRAAARAAGLGEDRAWLMRIGESRALPKRYPSN